MKTNFLLLNSVVSVLILSEIGLKTTLLSPDTMKPVPPYDVDVCPELNMLRILPFDDLILCIPSPLMRVSWIIITVSLWCRKSSARFDFLMLLFKLAVECYISVVFHFSVR